MSKVSVQTKGFSPLFMLVGKVMFFFMYQPNLSQNKYCLKQSLCHEIKQCNLRPKSTSDIHYAYKLEVSLVEQAVWDHIKAKTSLRFWHSSGQVDQLWTKGECCSHPQHILGKVKTVGHRGVFLVSPEGSLEWQLKPWDCHLIVYS